jgi:long-chain fatty acid transport protein
MKKFTGAGIALLLGTTAAYAGGMDRSGQSITALFEEGTYAEISFGSVSPDVTGVGLAAFGAQESGSVAPDYTTMGLAFKTDVNDKVSMAFIMDQPFGANVSYSQPTYPLNGTNAEVKSTGITVLGQYHVDENFSVYAGPRFISAEGFYDPTGVYASTYSKDSDVGYVVGGAYEITDIALRVAVTYSSQTDFALDGTAGDLTATMPQSVNLDFQTGIAANTLLFGSVRWADWSEATLDDLFLETQPSGGNLADFNDEDVYTYSIGVGRRFTDNFAAQISVGYEAATNQLASNLSPTDGYTSLSIGGAYTFENGFELSGGVRKVWLGDATTEAPYPFPAGTEFATFTDNSATAIGLKLAYNY